MDDKKICNECNCSYYGSYCPLCRKNELGKVEATANLPKQKSRKFNFAAFLFVLIIGIVLGVYFKDNIVGFFNGREIGEFEVINNAIPFPENGTCNYYSSIDLTGTMEFENKLDYYLFVKYKDETGSSTIVEAYIHPNSVVTLTLPIRNYKMYYAMGNTWYGNKKHFGANTIYYIANDILNIKHESFNGTYELYMPDSPSPFSDMQKTYKVMFED